MMSQAESSSGDVDPFMDRKPQNAGILVFARNREVLYVNQAGRECLRRLNAMETGGASNGLLPKVLVALIDEILMSRDAPVDDRGWRRFPSKRLGEATGKPLFVQAFAQPHDTQTSRPVIVLTIEIGKNEV
jgi:hypothetical protein